MEQRDIADVQEKQRKPRAADDLRRPQCPVGTDQRLQGRLGVFESHSHGKMYLKQGIQVHSDAELNGLKR